LEHGINRGIDPGFEAEPAAFSGKGAERVFAI
jgi:hypothetical protein